MNIAKALKKLEIQAKIYGSKLTEQEKINILSDIVGMNFTDVYLNKDKELDKEESTKLDLYINELCVDLKPLEKISNKAYFFGTELYVDENVLSPRNETEILVEIVIGYIEGCGIKKPKILDIGTGSGCIAIAIAKEHDSQITATDISEKALLTAKKNVTAHRLLDRVTLIRSDLFKDIASLKFDIIVSNPPYISSEEFDKLDLKVKDFDPKIALYGGIDGLDLYREIIKEAPAFLNENGMIFFEIGATQAGKVKKYLEKDFTSIKIVKDHDDNDRIIYGRFKKKEIVNG